MMSLLVGKWGELYLYRDLEVKFLCFCLRKVFEFILSDGSKG